jgi:prephenate dehydrogenase
MKSIAIVGFGRFGELLARLASTHFTVNILESDPSKIEEARSNDYPVIEMSELHSVDYIFLAVPISLLEPTLISISPFLKPSHLVIDLCSVKVYPTRLMKKYLSDVQILGSHPMFGPDSASKGLSGLQVALCPIKVSEDNLKIIRNFWADKNVVVLETTPEAHDKDTVYSQAFTYSIAKLIIGMDIPNLTFKTRSFKDIYEVATLSARDTDQLFHDMLFYNPYFSEMKIKLEKSIAGTSRILDEIANEQKIARPF